jgi:hypothetical protein
MEECEDLIKEKAMELSIGGHLHYLYIAGVISLSLLISCVIFSVFFSQRRNKKIVALINQHKQVIKVSDCIHPKLEVLTENKMAKTVSSNLENRVDLVNIKAIKSNEQWKLTHHEFFKSSVTNLPKALNKMYMNANSFPKDATFLLIFLEVSVACCLPTFLIWWPCMVVNILVELAGIGLISVLLSCFNTEEECYLRCKVFLNIKLHIVLISVLLFLQVFWCILQISVLGIITNLIWKLNVSMKKEYGPTLYVEQCANVTTVVDSLSILFPGAITSAIIVLKYYGLLSLGMYVISIPLNLFKIVLCLIYEYKKLSMYFQTL